MLFGFLFLVDPADASIRRTPGSWLFGPQPVFTDGSGSDLFHPMSAPMPSVGVLSVRVAYEMAADTGYCTLRPGVRFGNDGVGWDQAAVIDTTYQTSNGTRYTSAYVDLSTVATVKPWMQFGVLVKNDAGGSGFQHCIAQLLVEPKER